MTRDFDNLVDTDGLTPEERRRLAAVHEMLLVAGPPPELGASLEEAPTQPGERTADEEPAGARVHAFPRRRVGAVLIAAAVAVACFLGGYVLGHSSTRLDVVRVVPLEGVAQPASASLRV